ncbi:hypothetical protein [Flavobacterium anhuiense]|uniref:hypothetical protein n=1 Tax=Flavobacterium anhuiense TaxID=459526 RepID=UPI002026E8F4|nr:hypothetical protein [Flavobacterium anhuiense]URM37351.1 hypothetical protein LLY39_01820 [Flavobacterium anhuiense]
MQKKIELPSFNAYGQFTEKIGYNIYIFYLVFLLFLGVFLRLIGTARGDLLAILSSTFLQGMGIVLILFYLKFIKSNKKVVIMVSVLFCIIDVLFMGKQYFIALVTILIFLTDCYAFKIKLFHLLLILTISILFVFVINLSRGDFSNIDLFSSLMEFRGVFSSIQFANPNISVFDLSAFRSTVESNSIDVYGYNLAFHPLMFFRSISNNATVSIIAYSIFVFFLLKLMIRTIGGYAILIIALNFIHFLRHGIDLFLIKIIFQFFIVFLFRLKFDLNQEEIVEN